MENRLIKGKNKYHTYDNKFGDGRLCKCGHDYRSHFGSISDYEHSSRFCPDINNYRNVEVVECGECKCKSFREVLPKLETILLKRPEHEEPEMPEEMVKALEDGRLLATFVGLKVGSEQCNAYMDPIEYEIVIDAPDFIPEYDIDRLYEFESYPEFDYKFHSDWNWLIGVVEKIENIKDEQGCYLYSVDTGRDYCVIWTNDFNKELIYVSSVHNDKIASVYKTVLGFIKWYNKEK